MNRQNIKCVMVIDEKAPIGIIANTAAILGVSLGKIIPDIVGCDVIDNDNNKHFGIVKFPIPILKANCEKIFEIKNKLFDKSANELTIIDFSTLAQGCKTYDEYIEKMKATKAGNLDYVGIALCGNKKMVNKLTGNLPLMR